MRYVDRDSRQTRLVCALCAAGLVLAIYLALFFIRGGSASPYVYNSYLLQAQAWLRGETWLDHNYEYLELAVYEGKYYVSFPPVPSIPMLLFTLIWGDNVPGGLIQKFYVAIACLVILSTLQRARRMKPGDCVAWAIFLCFGCALLPISIEGGVWYEAQILAFLFSVCAISAMLRKRATLACFFYALSVGCRPFSALLGPALLAVYIQSARRRAVPPRRAFARLVPGLIVGLMIAAAYGWYNYIRFDNPFEFGHNYLPEFTRSEDGQFSLVYVLQNLPTLFFGAPFSVSEYTLSFNMFGFSMFLSCPVLLCGLVWLIRALVRRRMTALSWTLLIAGAANCFCLLMHRTLGAYQFGARYALELVPYCLIWLATDKDCRLSRWESVAMSFGLALNFLGAGIIRT